MLNRPRLSVTQVEQTLRPAHEKQMALALSILGHDADEKDVRRYFLTLPFRKSHCLRLAMLYTYRHSTSPDRPMATVTDYRAVPTAGPSAVGYRCVYCGGSATDMEHVWPRSRGGGDHPNNLVRSCRPCNSVKGTRSLINDQCPGCDATREPGDVETATGTAFYACRCGSSWQRVWDLQAVRL